MASSVKRVTNLVATWSMKAKQASSQPARAFAAAAAPAEALHTAEPTINVNLSAAAEAPAAPRTIADLSDPQLVHLLRAGLISPHRLEADLHNPTRAVAVRRAFVADALARSPAAQRVVSAQGASSAMAHLPSSAAAFDVDGFYKGILNTNCEAVIGYVPLPVGIVGPLLLDNKAYYVPMATTEGALLASTNRGCAAIRRAGGATTSIMADGMTRAPLVRVDSLAEAAALRAWIETPANYAQIEAAFNSTSRFGRLKSVHAVTAGRNVYLRFKASTGDAMGMNMITKGVSEALTLLHSKFPTMRVMSLSGNVCTDKKPSAINWIQGRGKSVSAEVRLSGHVLSTVLKTSADALVDLNTAKNLVGSALAGSVGGFNAHASNILTAVYLATGQDPAQNVESSTCLTLMEKDDRITDPADPEGKSGAGIIMTVTMPSVEVGTVGGGTSMTAQSACLELMGIKGSHPTAPGANAAALARIVAGSVLAGELSLMSALTTNDLLSSHMKLNRKPAAGAGGAGPSALLVSDAMLARLGELQGHASVEAAAAHPEGGSPASAAASAPRGVTYTTVYTPASGASVSSSETATSTPAASAGSYAPSAAVPGGAPAGAHAHPLHLQPATHGAAQGHGSAAASPGRRYFAAPAARMSRFGGHSAGSISSTHASPAPHWAGPSEGAAFFATPSIAAGVDEESRAAWDEPRLCVP